jgi:hypothetical protein
VQIVKKIFNSSFRQKALWLEGLCKMSGKNKALSRKNEKYYQLAKSHGFRSRAAFKLVQLNKKFDFLGSGNDLILVAS